MTLKRRLSIGFGILILCLIIFVKPFRFFDNLFYDLNFALSASPAADSVIVVGIDEKSIREIGAFPWPRSFTASLIEKISGSNPKALSLDFLFPKRPEKMENDSLASVLSRVKNLVLPFRAGNILEKPDSGTIPVSPEINNYRFFRLLDQNYLNDISFYTAGEANAADTLFSRYARYGGFLNVSTSNSSRSLREVIHVIKIGEDYFPSFGLSSVAAYYNLRSSEIVLDGKGWITLGNHKIPVSSYAATTFINFRNKNKPIKIISAVDVLQGRVDPKIFRDKLVFVGITDPAAGADFFTTPICSQFSGVAVWATIALDIIQNAWIRIENPFLSVVNWLLVFLIFPGLIFLIPSQKRATSILCGILLTSGSIAIGVLLFRFYHIFWDSSSHVYSFLFSFLWLAVRNSVPSLVQQTSVNLDPPDSVDNYIISSPSEQELSCKDLPDSETAEFVTKTLRTIDKDGEEQSEPLTFSGTIVEQKLEDLKGKPGTALTADFTDKARKIANGIIIRLLGSGGMSDVYLIWNPRLELYRAIKVIKPLQSANFLSRFETEIRIFSKLNHPNIVQCFGVGQWHSLPYLEMEYVHGVSMEEVVCKCKILTIEQSLAVGILVCRALHYAHNQVITIYGKTYKGIVHRDLKPANIMLSQNGRIKIMDFGIARPSNVSLHTNESGNIVGTLPYLAPEQLENGTLTGQADIYALGATLYQFISGERAFPQTDVASLVRAKTNGIYKQLTSQIKIDQEISAIIDRSLAVNLSDRFPSAKAFGEALEKALFKSTQTNGYAHIEALVKRMWKR